MIVTEAHRRTARAETKQKAATKKAMPAAVKATLGRGKCKDCDLPWDCVAVGFHIPIPETQDWLCGFCFTAPVVREKYGLKQQLAEKSGKTRKRRCKRLILKDKKAVFSESGPAVHPVKRSLKTKGLPTL